VKAQQMRKFIAQLKLQAKASPSPLLAEKIKVAERAYEQTFGKNVDRAADAAPAKGGGGAKQQGSVPDAATGLRQRGGVAEVLAEPSDPQLYLTMAAEGSPDNLENPENEEEINELLALESMGSPC
jgi:hypothetical protein